GGSWTATAMARPAATGWTVSTGCSATVTATAMGTSWTVTSSGPRSRRMSVTPDIFGTSISTGTATWTAGTTANSTAASASFEPVRCIEPGTEVVARSGDLCHNLRSPPDGKGNASFVWHS